MRVWLYYRLSRDEDAELNSLITDTEQNIVRRIESTKICLTS